MPQSVSTAHEVQNVASGLVSGTDAPSAGQTLENTGTVHENLEGWIADISTPALLREAVEKAFSYRGDVTIRTQDGRTVVGYLYDRSAVNADPSKCVARLLVEGAAAGESRREVLTYASIAGIEFTGKDTAAGKSFQTWLKKYQEKKAAGEKNIGLEPEPL